MTPTNDIKQRLKFIETYDHQIETLRHLRSEHTNYLETLAGAYDRAHPEDPGDNRRCCTASYFVFLVESVWGLHFGTYCQYDGHNAGTGITIPWDALDKLVTEGVQVP